MSVERAEIFPPKDPLDLSEDFKKCMDAIPRNTNPMEDPEPDETPGEYLVRIENALNPEPDYELPMIYHRRESSMHKKAVMAQVRSLIAQAPISQGYRDVIAFRFEELYVQGIDEDREYINEVDDPYFRFAHLVQLDEAEGDTLLFFEDGDGFLGNRGHREADAYKLTVGQHFVDQMLYPHYEDNEKLKDLIINWRETYIEKYGKPPIDFEI